MKQKTQLRGVLMLLLTAFIWGSAFVAQSVGMEKVQAFTFSGIRTLMGALVLVPFILIRDAASAKRMTPAQLSDRKKADKKAIVYGAVLGIFLCAASNFQQFAFYYSTSGKIAFVTAMYMFFVPLLGLIFRKRVPLITWLCVLIGFVGLYFLCIDPKNLGRINLGDILAFICAILFAVHILLIEKFAPDVDGVKLSCVQFFVSGIISCVLMFCFEQPKVSAIREAIVPMLYAGVGSCGLAYTFQIIGQKYTEATVASLLMCMESVFAVLTGALLTWLFPAAFHLGSLSSREIIGCAVMFFAIILSQFSDRIDSAFKAKRA